MGIKERLLALWVSLDTRRCHGCDDTSVHSHHLTALGRWHYTSEHARRRFARGV
jgi:hypothetical protein